MSTGGYTVDAASSANSNFAIGVQTTGNTIKWDNNYANGSAKTSSVTFTFTRPVSNFTVRVEDIDAGNNYLDQVVFVGKKRRCYRDAYPESGRPQPTLLHY